MSPTASEIVNRAPSAQKGQMQALRGVRVDNIQLAAFKDGRRSWDITERIIGGSIERTITGASVVEIQVNDDDRELLRSGRLHNRADIKLDGLWFRLVGVRKFGDTLTLRFEDRDVAFMRRYSKYKKADRDKTTRAQFAKSLVREVKERKIPFFSPDLNVRLPIAKPSERKTTETRTQERDFGFGSDGLVDFTVKGHVPNGIQVKNLERVLDVGVSMKARHKVLVTSMMTVIQESGAVNFPPGAGDLDSVGLFQQRPSQGWPATGKVEIDAAEFFRRVIEHDKKYPKLQLWALAQEIQRSAFPSAYDQWREESEAIVDAYGFEDSAESDIERQIPYHFSRGLPGEPEDTWTATGRLAEEIGWRRFMVSGTCYFISEERLFRAAPFATVTEETDGVHAIDADFETGKRTGEVQITAQLARWAAPPGTVIKVRGMGPMNGRWLVDGIRRDLFSPNGVIILRKPRPQLPEPAAEVETISAGDTGDDLEIAGGNVRQRIVAVAIAAHERASEYTYRQFRPYPPKLFSEAAKDKLDCSSFAILVYKEAGAGDPNGTNFDGTGYTGSLVRRGIRTKNPVIGDLAFYGGTTETPGHVDIYIGGGEVIGFGSTPIKRRDVKYRSDFRYYVTYPEETPGGS